MSDPLQFDTRAIRAGTLRTEFNEHSEALFLTSSFVFESAAQAAGTFAGSEDGVVYSRFSNPTVQMFEQRLASLENAEDGLATASGMAAILATAMAVLRSGDHIVCAANVFGATVQLFSNLLARFGIETTYVRGTDPQAWKDAMTPRTRLLYCETPSNPLMEIIDLAALAALGRAHGALTVVDNCFCTPVLQRPLDFGIDVVIHSATKFIDGQGRCLGGVVAGRAEQMKEVVGFLRTAGPTLSPFNAWVFLKGLETLRLRMQAHCATAQQLAEWLEQQPQVEKVYYAGLPSHPQHELAKRQQKGFGAVVSFEVKGGKVGAWRFIDATLLFSITANLGDAKSTITHPGTTTHGRLSPEDRAKAGIRDSLIRIAVGLEEVDDLKSDLALRLASL